MFQGRVDGVGSQRARADGDVTFEKELSLTEIVNRIKVPNANTGDARPKTDDSFEKYQKESAKASLGKSSLALPLLLGAAYLLLS
jgi:hypothetical protein